LIATHCNTDLHPYIIELAVSQHLLLYLHSTDFNVICHMDFDSIHMTQDEIVIAGLKTEESHPFMPQKEKHFSVILENCKYAKMVKK